MKKFLASLALVVLTGTWVAKAAQVPVVSTTNLNVRIMAANLTGNSQIYEPPAIRIFQGLKPDIVAIQEFNYGDNSATAISGLISTAFGSNYYYFRETGYSIPNGIISRWPFVTNGQWIDSDTGVNDRGFAWAQIDMPGTNDLFVVSIHLKASSGAPNETRRAAEAAEVKSNIAKFFPYNAWLVVAGDCNIQNTGEVALATLKSFLSDDPIPTDADTNNSRAERYDYVFPNPAWRTNLVATVIGAQTFPNGLVFDSRVFSPLSAVAPVLFADSGNAQHMAVIRDFQISGPVTNLLDVPLPALEILSQSVLRWQGLSQLTYTVEATTQMPQWTNIGTATSTSGVFRFTNSSATSGAEFYRVRFP